MNSRIVPTASMMKVSLQNPLDDDDEIAPRRVEKGGLDDLPSPEGDPPPHQPEDDDGKGDDPEPPDLEEEQRHDLTGEGEILPDVDDGKARHADRRGGGEEGIHEAQVIARSPSKGSQSRMRPDRISRAKLRMKILRRREVPREPGSDAMKDVHSASGA